MCTFQWSFYILKWIHFSIDIVTTIVNDDFVFVCRCLIVNYNAHHIVQHVLPNKYNKCQCSSVGTKCGFNDSNEWILYFVVSLLQKTDKYLYYSMYHLEICNEKKTNLKLIVQFLLVPFSIPLRNLLAKSLAKKQPIFKSNKRSNHWTSGFFLIFLLADQKLAIHFLQCSDKQQSSLTLLFQFKFIFILFWTLAWSLMHWKFIISGFWRWPELVKKDILADIGV